MTPAAFSASSVDRHSLDRSGYTLGNGRLLNLIDLGRRKLNTILAMIGPSRQASICLVKTSRAAAMTSERQGASLGLLSTMVTARFALPRLTARLLPCGAASPYALMITGYAPAAPSGPSPPAVADQRPPSMPRQ